MLRRNLSISSIVMNRADAFAITGDFMSGGRLSGSERVLISGVADR